MGTTVSETGQRVLSDLHGFGLGVSSARAVLAEVGRWALYGVARRALLAERGSGRCVAAQDVFSIALGGVSLVRTEGETVFGVEGEAVPHDPDWLAKHLLLAWDPNGVRHSAPDTLERLFTHPDRAWFVRYFSGLAERAAEAVTGRRVTLLAQCINAYREAFDAWSDGGFTDHAYLMASRLAEHGALGWKCPGAGGCAALLAVVKDVESMQECQRYVGRHGWSAMPVHVTGGLAVADGAASCGHRVDLIGAADLGQDPSINEPGVCLAVAIEPRLSRSLGDEG